MKKFFFVALLVTVVFGFASLPTAIAQEPEPQPVYLTVFWGNGCPHCEAEFEYLEKLETEFLNLHVRKLEVWYNQQNARLMGQVAKELGINASGVPLTIIGRETIFGYLNDETTGAEMREIIVRQSSEGSIDFVGEFANLGPIVDRGKEIRKAWPEKLTLPVLGEINLRAWSLPALTAVFGILDGFNPCAMWVLIFLISLLLGMQDRWKMWLLGGSFILVSGLVYLVFMAAWLNIFLFIGYITIIRSLIGLVAVGGGIYYLRKWWLNRSGCEVADDDKREKIMDRLRRITSTQTFWLALVGIVALAASVNMVELVCSAGLPAIYTNILSLSELPTWQYYGYLLLYILFYMLDDMIVFIIAMTSMRAFGLSTRYAHWSYLVGGAVILIVGVLLLVRPSVLMFG